MPQLRCSAQNCAHNSEQCCCRGEIKVAGNQAHHSENTCCSNFYEDQGGARNSVSQAPTVQMNVGCEATNCTHNNNCNCAADSIDVSGYNACNCDDTCCSSFYPK